MAKNKEERPSQKDDEDPVTKDVIGGGALTLADCQLSWL